MTSAVDINVQLAYALYTQIMIRYSLQLCCNFVSIPIPQTNSTIIAQDIRNALLWRAAKSPAAGFLSRTSYWCYINRTNNRIYLQKRSNPKNKTQPCRLGNRGQK